MSNTTIADKFDRIYERLNEFNMALDNDNGLMISNSIRKVTDVLLLYLEKQSRIPRFILEKDTIVNVIEEDLNCLSDSDPIVETAVTHALRVYGWKLPTRLNYREKTCKKDIVSHFPRWYHEHLTSIISDFVNECYENEEGEEDVEEQLISNSEGIVITTFTNDKISKIFRFHDDSVNEMDDLDFSELKCLIAYLYDPYVVEVFGSEEVQYHGRYFFSILSYELADESGYTYDFVNYKKYFNPSIIFRLKEIEDKANEIITKYKI